MLSGRSSVIRTARRSVPQTRQYWLSCRSSEPQDGQYMSLDDTAVLMPMFRPLHSTFTPRQNATLSLISAAAGLTSG
jgi:hypothetical protein